MIPKSQTIFRPASRSQKIPYDRKPTNHKQKITKTMNNIPPNQFQPTQIFPNPKPQQHKNQKQWNTQTQNNVPIHFLLPKYHTPVSIIWPNQTTKPTIQIFITTKPLPKNISIKTNYPFPNNTKNKNLISTYQPKLPNQITQTKIFICQPTHTVKTVLTNYT